MIFELSSNAIAMASNDNRDAVDANPNVFNDSLRVHLFSKDMMMGSAN